MRWVVGLVLLLGLGGNAYALSGGNDSSNDIGQRALNNYVPNGKVKIAEELKRSFTETPLDLLKDQRWAGELCYNHPCGEISEVNAKDLLDGFLAKGQSQKAEARIDAEAKDRKITYTIAFGALFVSLLTLAYTVQSNRRRDKLKS